MAWLFAKERFSPYALQLALYAAGELNTSLPLYIDT